MTANASPPTPDPEHEPIELPLAGREPLFTRCREMLGKRGSTYITLPSPSLEILNLTPKDLATVSVIHNTDETVDDIIISPTRGGPVVVPGIGFQRSIIDHSGAAEVNIPRAADCDPGVPWEIDVYQDFVHLSRDQ